MIQIILTVGKLKFQLQTNDELIIVFQLIVPQIRWPSVVAAAVASAAAIACVRLDGPGKIFGTFEWFLDWTFQAFFDVSVSQLGQEFVRIN